MIDVRLASCMLLALVLGGCGSGAQWHASEPETRSSIFDHPWVWRDDVGAPQRFVQWRGKPFVLTMMYTSCDGTCPRTLTQLRQLSEQYAREHKQAEFVVVTLDPENDTPEQLRMYRQMKALPATWHLWTGSRAETDELLSLLGIHVMAMESHTVHDSKIVVFDGNGVSTSELLVP